MKMLINNDLPVILVKDYIMQIQTESTSLPLMRPDGTAVKCLFHIHHIKKINKKVYLRGSFEWHIWEKFTLPDPGVKQLRGISSSPNGTRAWCKFTQSLKLRHNTFFVPCHAPAMGVFRRATLISTAPRCHG